MKFKQLNKTAKCISINKINNFFLLILITLLLFANSCKNNKINKKNAPTYKAKINNNSIVRDSIVIKILVPANQFLLLNIRNKNLQNDALYFKNSSAKDSTITKKIFSKHKKQIIRFGMVVMDKGKIQNHFKHFYLIDEKLDNLSFELKKNNDLKLLGNKAIIVDEIHKKYDSLKIFLNKTKKRDTLKQVYFYFKEKYKKEDKTLFAELNKVFYLSLLSNINDKEVNKYLENIEKPIISDAFTNLFYTYTKKNILKFDYSILNSRNKNEEFLRYLSITMFNYLNNEENKGDNRYFEALKWLKTTSFYEENSTWIDKKLSPINKNVFKKKIKKLRILDTNLRASSFSEFMFNNSSKYYLIDFWATWCAPCIGGVKLMNKMDFPKDVKVISISLDKVKDIEKWKHKTKELQQQYTYWLDEKSSEGKSFLKFIELQSIPRYILIDEDLNLIDQAFLHPNEPDFLTKLKDVKNSEYW